MIVVTGAAGFIGSNLVSFLNQKGHKDIVVVDKFDNEAKNANLHGKDILERVERGVFFEWFQSKGSAVKFVFHIGARTDTTEFDKSIFDELNVGYSQKMWEMCSRFQVPLVYASSAATYGMGELGYQDSHEIIPQLKPLNPYGDSKNDFDKWVLQQTVTPPAWYGLKFFNVYGPNEYHKSRMASVVFHAFNQIKKTNGMKLFRSHNPNYKNGEQLRDFVYVKDVVQVCTFLMEQAPESAIFNLGTGQARTFWDLTANTFKALGVAENISFVDTPEDIRDKYQYFTEATMDKLKKAGYPYEFTSLEDGVTDYVQNYLEGHKYN